MTEFRDTGKWPGTLKRTEDAQLLGEVLESFMGRRVCTRYEQAEGLRQAWLEVVPAELAEHCRLDGLSGEVLKVVVDGPGYMHEVRLCKKELCERIRSVAPRCSVKNIKVVIG